jgi:hypothetical protein
LGTQACAVVGVLKLLLSRQLPVPKIANVSMHKAVEYVDVQDGENGSQGYGQQGSTEKSVLTTAVT